MAHASHSQTSSRLNPSERVAARSHCSADSGGFFSKQPPAASPPTSVPSRGPATSSQSNYPGRGPAEPPPENRALRCWLRDGADVDGGVDACLRLLSESPGQRRRSLSSSVAQFSPQLFLAFLSWSRLIVPMVAVFRESDGAVQHLYSISGLGPKNGTFLLFISLRISINNTFFFNYWTYFLSDWLEKKIQNIKRVLFV